MAGRRDDVADLLLAIEVEAVQRLAALTRSIQLGEVDRQRFLETSRQYREAALANHQAMAPEVRDRLLVVLLKSYRDELDRLLGDIARRSGKPTKPVLNETAAATITDPAVAEGSIDTRSDPEPSASQIGGRFRSWRQRRKPADDRG